MTPPPPGLNGPNLPPSSDDRNESRDQSSPQDPLFSELRARVVSADFAPRVATIMFCENISGGYAAYSEQQLDNCREAYIVRDHMRDSRESGFSDLSQRFQNAWQGIKEEIAQRCAGEPQVAQKVAAFFIGHLVSETGWCLLTRDILADIKKVHSQLEASTMKPFRREVDVLQYRIDYLTHDQGYTPESRKQFIAAKREDQMLSGRKALGEVVRAHNEVRNRFGALVDSAVSELERVFLPKFTVEEDFHEKMARSLSSGFQEPLENMLEVHLRYRHDQIAQYLTKHGMLQPGEQITPLLSGKE